MYCSASAGTSWRRSAVCHVAKQLAAFDSETRESCYKAHLHCIFKLDACEFSDVPRRFRSRARAREDRCSARCERGHSAALVELGESGLVQMVLRVSACKEHTHHVL
jgi:hypothetical protein